MRPFLALLLAAASVAGQGAASAESSERADLARERKAIETDYDRREQACRGQFVVTPCLEKVRRERNEALSTVKAREGALDSAERLERAQAQKQRLAEKAAASQARAASAAAPASGARGDKARPAPSPRKDDARPLPDAAARKAREEASKAAYEARQEEIRAHRAEVLKRNAAKAGRQPQPLPPPASAASR